MAHVYVDVDMDDFDDDEIVDAVIARKLQGKVFAKAVGARDERLELDPIEKADEIQALLAARHYGKAASEMMRFLHLLIPPQIAEAADHIRNGQYSAAICELERFSRPSPAATATKLPKNEDTVSV